MQHIMNLPDGNGGKLVVKLDSDSVHIIDSYKIKSTKQMKNIIRLIRYAAVNCEFNYKRTRRSWLREWKAHNILYSLNIKRKSAINTDLDESESFGRRFVYFVLSLFYWR